MTKVIWKFPLVLQSEQEILLPQEHKFIHAGLDPEGALCVWAEVQPNTEKGPRIISLRGTGHRLTGKEGPHIGSILQGSFIWHIYGGPLL